MFRYIAILFILAAGTASAQSDVLYAPVSGVYTVKAQMGADADTAQFCVARVDVAPVIEYGCVPALAGEIVEMPVTVEVTLNDDAELRGYAVDESGLTSDYSPNAGRVDFTRPGAPLLVP